MVKKRSCTTSLNRVWPCFNSNIFIFLWFYTFSIKFHIPINKYVLIQLYCLYNHIHCHMGLKHMLTFEKSRFIHQTASMMGKLELSDETAVGLNHPCFFCWLLCSQGGYLECIAGVWQLSTPCHLSTCCSPRGVCWCKRCTMHSCLSQNTSSSTGGTWMLFLNHCLEMIDWYYISDICENFFDKHYLSFSWLLFYIIALTSLMIFNVN